MTLASLIELLRKDYLDDSVVTKQRWDDAFFIRAFSEAQKQACNRTDFIFTDSLTITLVAGTGSYVLPANLTKLLCLVFDNRELSKSLPEQLREDWRELTGFSDTTDRKYIVRGNLVTFTPTPDSVDTGLLVTIEGFTQPSSFTATTESPVIPVEYHKDLIHWVLHEAYSNDDYLDVRDEQKSAAHLAQFDKTFGKPVAANVRKHQFETNMR